MTTTPPASAAGGAKAFQAFYDLIVLFHRALARGDRAMLRRLLTADAAGQWASAEAACRLPLSDDIAVDGFVIEGSGALTVVRYRNRLEHSAEVLELTVELTTIAGELRIAQPYPTLVRRTTPPPPC